MHLGQAVPEIPVADVEVAQTYYRDRFGFKIEWIYPGGEIGAVSHGECILFFRRTEGPITTGTYWMFSKDADAALAEMKQSKADIVEDIEDKPWGLRQFTVADMNGNRFYIHHDVQE